MAASLLCQAPRSPPALHRPALFPCARNQGECVHRIPGRHECVTSTCWQAAAPRGGHVPAGCRHALRSTSELCNAGVRCGICTALSELLCFLIKQLVCGSLECAVGSHLLILLFDLMKESHRVWKTRQSPWEHLC